MRYYYPKINFVGFASKQGVNIVLSGYVEEGDGAYFCVKVQDGDTEQCEGLKSNTDEAGRRIIPYITQAAKDGYQRALVIANDTDVFSCIIWMNLKNALQGTVDEIRNGDIREIYTNTFLVSQTSGKCY